MRTLILIMLLIGVTAKAENLDLQIKTAITKAAAKYSVPERELLKIAFVESTIRKNPPMRKNKNGTYDVGTFQINSIHWNTECKGLDVSKLDGNAMCAAKLLSTHKSKAKTDKNWVARYHSKTCKANFCPKMIYADKLEQAEMYLIEKNIGRTLASN